MKIRVQTSAIEEYGNAEWLGGYDFKDSDKIRYSVDS